MTRDNTVRLIVAFVIIVLLCLLQNAINVKRSYRGRQVLLPWLALAFGMVGSVVLSLRFIWSESICDRLEFLQNGNILVLNVLLMGGFLLVKCVACPLLSFKWKDNKLMEETSSRFYEYDSVYNQWFLQIRWADFRRVIKAFAWAGEVLCAGLLAITWIQGVDSPVWIVCFPGGALIVLNEVWCYINGQTREEFIHSVLGDESDARRVSNYYRIREIYEKLFTPQLLASHTGCEFFARQGSAQLLKIMEESEDRVEKNTAQYFLTVDSRLALDSDCIQAVSTMMRGESVVFFNPFYRNLGVYLTLPIVNALLRGGKCLVVAGRSSVGQDAVVWLTELLRNYSHLRSMWRVKPLDKGAPECEVGVLSFRQLYDAKVLAANRDFFSQAEFVLLLEPSIMVDTGQVGVSIIAQETNRYDDAPVYCICDRYTDGLVDTMSHLLRTEITNVVAMPVPRCIYTGMAWNADGDFLRQKLFDKQTRFLGNGMELAAVAVKNQIPQVTWYSETKSPMRDLKWIAGQHHATICRYMNLPAQQKSLYEKIHFVPNLWCTEDREEQFILVEDEFCNMFSMMRTFLSRGSRQAFVNVLSENYLLRDYMRCNQQMFLSNPNAIPSLIPDYAKTTRNTLMKLIVMMAFRPVGEMEVIRELQLAGCQAEDPFDSLSKLLKQYTFVDGSILDIKSVPEDEELISARTVSVYSISKENFEKYFSDSLKNAYYIVEEEKQESDYIDGKMFGHVTQTILPGQFVTYDGKYYQVKLISPENGIILRRASELYTGRRYYRQIRTYQFAAQGTRNVIYARTVMDIEIAIVSRDFDVITGGYLDMSDNHDLRLAKVISFEGDPCVRNFDRHYKNKDVLQIKFPDTDDKLRFTLCLLLSEVFRSVFPDAWQYLAVLTKSAEGIEGMLNYVVYSLEGEAEEPYIYVVEDSDIDLGLLDAVNRNLPQLLEIVADFLDWHFEKMREPERADPVLGEVTLPEDEKRRSRFLEMAERIRKLFRRGNRKEDAEANTGVKHENRPPIATQEKAVDQKEKEQEKEYSLDEEKPVTRGSTASLLPQTEDDLDEDFDLETEGHAENQEHVQDQSPTGSEERQGERKKSQGEELLAQEEDADLVHIDGTDIFEPSGVPEDNIWLEDALTAAGVMPIRKSRYQKECYLKFGFEEIDSRLKIEDVHRYLRVRGCSNGSLTKARKRSIVEKQVLDVEVTNHCDFCGMPLSGVSYDKLTDGRVRCNDCSTSAITTLEDFRDLFYRVLEMMEGFYSVSYHVPISVRMADARTVARGAGQIFRPSTQVAARVLGYAQRRNGRYSLLIENGSPRLAAIDTMVHELTHIWQYLNWNDHEVQRLYGNGRNREIVYEGMAAWASVQFLYQMGETYYAEQQENTLSEREDVYGSGFLLYRERYPFVKDLSLLKFSPFSIFPPL